MPNGLVDGETFWHGDYTLTGFAFRNVFGGMDGSFDGDKSVIIFPASASGWAGVANSNTDLYPMKLGSTAPKIKFTASVPDGNEVVVRFKFENNPSNLGNTEPSYETGTVTVSGSTSTDYEIDLANQGDNTFSSFILYLNTRDKGLRNRKCYYRECRNSNLHLWREWYW